MCAEHTLPEQHRRPWSDTDKDKLTFWWGTFKLPTLATRLNRTQWAVAQMARQLKLGPFSRGEGISMREFERISGYSSSKIEAAAKALDIKLKRIERSDPIRRRPLARFVITDDQQDALLQHMLAHENYYMNLPGSGKTTRGVWGIGKKPSACQRCGRNDRPHFSNGYCKPCQVFVHKRNKRMNDTSPIMRFTGHYRFLSNFFPATIVYEDEKYYSLEHAYQATKTTDLKKRVPLQFKSGTALSISPGKAKSWGRAVTLRPDWETIKLKVMEDLLRLKFEIPDLRAQLMATGSRELIEGNNWNDRFWGKCELGGVWEGENHLGKLLMKIRDELHEQYAKTEHERVHDDA